MINYIVAASKSWFKEHPKSPEYKKLNFIEINSRDELNLKNLERINPRYIFFPHWSWRVESEIYERFECVAFHTAPLPYGRGGSPIQNLILNGLTSSPVCALKMVSTLDGGPIYSSQDVLLNGTITEIFARIAACIERLILLICQTNPIPSEQVGHIVNFTRLTIADNEIKANHSLIEIYDRIRMVDGLDYPRAYINYGNHKIEFSDAKIENGQLTAKVKLVKKFSQQN